MPFAGKDKHFKRFINGRPVETRVLVDNDRNGEQRCKNCAFCEFVISNDKDLPPWYCAKGQDLNKHFGETPTKCTFFKYSCEWNRGNPNIIKGKQKNIF